MLARSYLTDLHHFPDIEFQQIIPGLRRLRPACDEIATASPANNIPRMQEVDEGVVQLVKDCAKKLTKTIQRPNKPFPQVSGVPPAQVRVPDMVVSANAPPRSEWGLETAVQNAGAGLPNALPANALGPAQIQPPAPAASPYQNPTSPPNPQGPIQLPLPASGNPGPSGSARQNVPPPPVMPPLKFQLHSSDGILKISGAALANNHQQIFPLAVVNNTLLKQSSSDSQWCNPNPGSPAESPRAKPTSLDSV